MTINNIQSIRGMHDYLPNETIIWQYIEDILKKVIISYGYREIRLPIIEQTSLFQRVIGTMTDIVEKEMYIFNDRNDKSLALRPEGTAGCIRACIEHGLIRHNQEQRLWYIGPMFRYERPQKGRYRQFNQLGVEVLGLEGPSIDAELIMICARCWNILGISKYLSLEINSIGSVESRNRYRDALVLFLEKNKADLDDDCRRKIYKNPLRILDSKNPNVQTLLNSAPILIDYLDKDSRKHFISLCNLLKDIGICYKINPRLVRGIDYYNYTVFEWITENLDSQNTICAGGRYDGLINHVNNKYFTPSIGFAIGLERLISLFKSTNSNLKIDSKNIIYLISSPNKSNQCIIMQFAEQLRNELPNIKIMVNHSNKSLKKQFSFANKLNVTIVLVLSETEMKNDTILVKDLRSGSQTTIMKNDIVKYLNFLLTKSSDK